MKHLRYKGKNLLVIYVKCDKAVYVTITAALLSYNKLIGHLVDLRFKMNSYKPCYWNMIINEEQFTIVLQVDGLKLSHKDSKVVSDIIGKLESIYAIIDPMTVR